MFSAIMGSPYRFLIAAAVLAAILCLFPARVEEPLESAWEAPMTHAAQPGREAASPPVRETGEMAGADLSARTQKGCYLHSTLIYGPCGHSVQRRENLPAQLVGLTRQAIESEIADAIPGAVVTGFSGTEVDCSRRMDIPCPLHWVLRSGEDGMLGVWQNLSGEALALVRGTDIPLARAAENEQEELRGGRVFDDVQALEGYLESLSS